MPEREPDASALGSRIEKLLDDIGGLGEPRATRLAEELVSALMRFYGEGLERVLALAAESDPALVDRIADDGLLGGLLVLHDLHPRDTEARVQEALEQVRPYLGSHAGDVAVTGIDDDGVLHLELQGSCDGCPSSAVTVKLAIEKAIEAAAPELTGIEVAGVAPEPQPSGPGGRTLLPLVNAGPDPEPEWVDVADVAALQPGGVAATTAGGVAVVVCALPDELFAYVDRCPTCADGLGATVLDGEHLRCAGCGTRYSVRAAGKAADSGTHLDPLPLLRADAAVRVAVPTAASTTVPT